MTRKLALPLLLATLLTPVALAQTEAIDRKLQAVNAKIRKVDLLYNILPVVITKDQVKLLLPVLEKCRARVKTTKEKDHEELAKLEEQIDQTIAAGAMKSELPTRAMLAELNNLLDAIAARRMVVIEQNIQMVMDVIDLPVAKGGWHAGQRSAAANTLKPQAFGLNVKAESLTLDEKIRMYVREILLDPGSYELLVAMSR